MKVISFIALILVIVGALNWLLVGLFAFDFVAWIFGAASVGARIVYSLVGVAGIWTIFYLLAFNPLKRLA